MLKHYNKSTNTLNINKDFLRNYNQELIKKILPTAKVHIYDVSDIFAYNSVLNFVSGYSSKKYPELAKFVSKAYFYHFYEYFDNEIYGGTFNNYPLITTVKFNDRFNQKIFPGSLPPNLTDLTFGNSFNQELKPNGFPPNLINLTFGYSYNQPIKLNYLPSKLKSITFGHSYNQIIIESVLPNSLEKIIFGELYAQPIYPNTLPKKLSIIIFGNNFDNEISSLPKSIVHLYFGKKYSKKISPRLLPITLNVLHFYGSNENSVPINNLPVTVDSLVLYNIESTINNLHILFKQIKFSCDIYSKIDDIRKIKYPWGCLLLDKTNKPIDFL
jgi:hypothetical protein